MSTFNPMHQRIRRIIADAGGTPDGNEVFYFPDVTQKDMPKDGSQLRAIFGLSKNSPAIRGSIPVVYFRMTLSEMFKNIAEPVIYSYNPQSSKEVAEAFVNQYGLFIDPTWIEDFQISKPPFRVKIDLKWTDWTRPDLTEGEYGRDNRIWITVGQPDMDLGQLFKNNVLSYPRPPYVHRLGYTNTELLSYGVDFTPAFEEDYINLTEIATTEDINGLEDPSVWRANTLINLIKSRLNIQVTRGLGREFELSLYGAEFIYNGPSQGYASADVRYDRVLVFKTLTDPAVDEAVYTYRGTFYMHYNNVI